MNINTAFPSNYLKASDLGDAQPVVTISHLKMEPIGKDKEIKPVLYFKGKDKGVVLNKTNAKKITQLLGSDDTDSWEGCKVRLFATETEFGGETVECIRVKAVGNTAPAKPKPEPVVTPDDDNDSIPF